MSGIAGNHTEFYKDPATKCENDNLTGYFLKYWFFEKETTDVRVNQDYEMGLPSNVNMAAHFKNGTDDIRLLARRCLSNEKLLETYKPAIELKTDAAFILLLREEIQKRNLKVASHTKKKQGDVLKLTTR